VPFADDVTERCAIIWRLRNRFAEMQGLPSPIVYDQLQVVRRNGACDSIAASFYALDGSARRSVLQYDT